MTNEAVTKAYADRASAHTVMQIEHAKRNALDVFVYRLREFFGNAVTRTVTGAEETGAVRESPSRGVTDEPVGSLAGDHSGVTAGAFMVRAVLPRVDVIVAVD